VREWIKLFLSISGQRKGYRNASVTPYMHAAAYHLQYVLDEFRNAKQFSGQGQ